MGGVFSEAVKAGHVLGGVFVLVCDVGEVALVRRALGRKGRERGDARRRGQCCWAGAGAAAAVSFWEGGFEDGPARVPVLEGEGIPVGPAGPGHAGVAGEVLAEADPVVRGELLGHVLVVLRSQCHQVLVADLMGRERLQSVCHSRSGIIIL